MLESPYDERRFKVSRPSCISQPREMVNVFFVLMKNMSTSEGIERALVRLRQRYDVFGGLTSEPKIAKIRTGPRVAMSVASLKAFNEDLNTLEVYAHAHDELDKLSGQLMLDTANQLPGVLKRRFFFYLLYLSSIHEKAMYRYVLGGESALAWELPFPGHLSST